MKKQKDCIQDIQRMNVPGMLSELRKTVESLSPLKEEEWNDFQRCWKPEVVMKENYLLKAGAVEKYFYFVCNGVLRVYILSKGVEVSVGFSYNGDFSGAYDSFLSQKPADMHVQALTNTHVLKITYNNLMLMFDRYKSIERWGRVFNANMLIGMGRRQVEVRSYCAEERFDRLFTQSPHIFQLVPQKYLASYLGMTPETFSRLRKAKMLMERDNLS